MLFVDIKGKVRDVDSIKVNQMEENKEYFTVTAIVGTRQFINLFRAPHECICKNMVERVYECITAGNLVDLTEYFYYYENTSLAIIITDNSCYTFMGGEELYSRDDVANIYSKARVTKCKTCVLTFHDIQYNKSNSDYYVRTYGGNLYEINQVDYQDTYVGSAPIEACV